MPADFFNWMSLAIAAAALIVGILGLRSPKVRKLLGLKVRKSKRVEINATDKTEADINVDRSEDVKISIGSKHD